MIKLDEAGIKCYPDPVNIWRMRFPSGKVLELSKSGRMLYVWAKIDSHELCADEEEVKVMIEEEDEAQRALVEKRPV